MIALDQIHSVVQPFPFKPNTRYLTRMRLLLSLATTLLATALPLTRPQEALSQEVSAKLLGGFYAPTAAGGRIAYFETRNSACTGTLVGKNLVLTAAHCVYEEGNPNNYKVFVGGARRAVKSVWHDSSFDINEPIVEMRPYDIGMIVLKQNVTKLPVPVLVGRRPRAYDRLVVAGYGLSERDARKMTTYKELFKIGDIEVREADGKMLYSTHRPTDTSLCGGDSGGPALRFFGNHIAQVGVASTGTNDSRSGRCYLSGRGISTHVDLQSSTSLDFLAEFDGVEYATWGDMALAKVVDDMKPRLAKAARAPFLTRIRTIARQSLAELRRAGPNGSDNRQSLVSQAIDALTQAKNASSLTTAKLFTRKAQGYVSRLSRMGIT
jgi:V8-like Glu-specific endopeptidase